MKDIRIGDCVVCIDNRVSGRFSGESVDLTIGKDYVVIDIETSEYSNYRYIRILDDVDVIYGYYEYRFISLRQHRLLKLEKLNSINISV